MFVFFRYQAVQHPFSYNKTMRIWLVICLLWTMATFVATIHTWAFGISVTTAFCKVHNEDFDLTVMAMLIISFGLLALSLVCYFHCKIIIKVRRHSRSIGSNNTDVADSSCESATTRDSSNDDEIKTVSNTFNSQKLVGRRKEARMALKAAYVVLSMALLWLPLMIFCSMLVFGWYNLPEIQVHTILLDLLTCAKLSQSLNPLVYGLTVTPFRYAFLKIVRQCRMQLNCKFCQSDAF